MIAGLSMGGYGSLYYAGLHPEMFSYVYSCSPAVWDDVYELYEKNLNSGNPYPGVTIESGTEDQTIGNAPQKFDSYLTNIGYEHEAIFRPGSHDWPFWTVCADKIIKKATTLFK